MRMSGNAAPSNSKLEGNDVSAISQCRPLVTSAQNTAEGTIEKQGPLPSANEAANSTGLLLLDTSLRPLYANQEAWSLLTYPANSKNNRPDSLLESRVQTLFEESNGSMDLKSNGSLTLGRRRYHLRVFSVRSPLANGLKPAIAILLERSKKSNIDLFSLSRRFRLTKREVETVEHLVHGFSTKQIAERMNISPNTVKAFLRSIMMKMAADSRAGIIARILQA